MVASIQERLLSVVRSKLDSVSGLILIAVSGSQGSGKTTVTRLAASVLSSEGYPTISLSLDDFYLTHQDQTSLASKGNRLLAKRGLPGTHDIPLLKTTLQLLKAGKATTVPSYDKSRFAGSGDRSNPVAIPEKLRVVLLEGWSVGFRPIGQSAIEQHRQLNDDTTRLYSVHDLVEVDDNLKNYTDIWDSCDALLHMEPLSLKYIYTWRQQQESQLRQEKGEGMSDEEVVDFVNLYMPMYELYARTVQSNIHVYLTLDRKVADSPNELELKPSVQ